METWAIILIIFVILILLGLAIGGTIYLVRKERTPKTPSESGNGGTGVTGGTNITGLSICNTLGVTGNFFNIIFVPILPTQTGEFVSINVDSSSPKAAIVLRTKQPNLPYKWILPFGTNYNQGIPNPEPTSSGFGTAAGPLYINAQYSNNFSCGEGILIAELDENESIPILGKELIISDPKNIVSTNTLAYYWKIIGITTDIFTIGLVYENNTSGDYRLALDASNKIILDDFNFPTINGVDTPQNFQFFLPGLFTGTAK
jgi:hypothetical protein